MTKLEKKILISHANHRCLHLQLQDKSTREHDLLRPDQDRSKQNRLLGRWGTWGALADSAAFLFPRQTPSSALTSGTPCSAFAELPPHKIAQTHIGSCMNAVHAG